ncbi:alpha/beta hydrolase [Micrococcoides hystricis]|uniref:Alpha/beta hydrolase n=1 Tax=Micrococcoides hystricis TaxID=1572761 RepID=A0ABV6PCK6_9MICC
MNVRDYFENPVVEYSRQDQERPGTDLLVLLHGYGADELDLMGLAPHLPQHYTIASVRAPLAIQPGYTWYPLDQNFETNPADVLAAITGLDSWLAAQAEQYAAITLLGFSMGMSMATSMVRMAPERYKALVGLSGFAINPESSPQIAELFDDEALAARSPKLPMFWGRDQADPVIRQHLVDYTHGWVQDHVDLTKVVYANMGHAICAQELGHIGEFLNFVAARTA